MQKYIHLVQIMETEKVAANQLRTQLEDQETEIERLKAEVCLRASTLVYIHTNTHTNRHELTRRLLSPQIVVLNKTKEWLQPCQGNQEEEEDPDIKKIKKVNAGRNKKQTDAEKERE